MTTKFSVKHQGKDIHHPPSTIYKRPLSDLPRSTLSPSLSLSFSIHSVITNDSPSSYIHKSAKNCAPLDDPCGIQESNRNRINNTLGQGYDYCECGDGVNRFYWMKVQTKLTVDSKNPNTNNTCKLRSKYLLVSSGQSILSIWESDCASSS